MRAKITDVRELYDAECKEYTRVVAKTVDEPKALIEEGFEYATEREGVKVYRKRK